MPSEMARPVLARRGPMLPLAIEMHCARLDDTRRKEFLSCVLPLRKQLRNVRVG